MVREDFNAETVVETLLEVFERQGLPRCLRFDRDTRFVGSSSSRDFPSAMVRMLQVLGVQPRISPTHRPDKYPYVERYKGSFKRECLLVRRPENSGQVKEYTAEYKAFYNNERPHQGRSCNNQPPRVAFPELPALPSLPLVVGPDSWLGAIDGEHFSRKVRSDGSISVDKYDYYLGRELAGEYVLVKVDGAKKELVVAPSRHKRGKEGGGGGGGRPEIKRFGIKGLSGQGMSLSEYRQAIMEEAR